MRVSRRSFLNTAAAAAGGLLAPPAPSLAFQNPRLGPPLPPLSERFEDLSRHFIFEYYAWWATSPWRHWEAAGRRPPIDVASNYMPWLGAYDSASRRVMEQHARWINESGAGAINVSWWGRGNDVDRLIHDLMDVMGAHDVHVTFHIEPYNRSRAYALASDIQYLLYEYGERRHWDCFLLPKNADGRSGPLFKTFATIEGPEYTDCHGVTFPNTDWIRDDVWREQTDRVRQTLRTDFDHLTLLADCSAVDRVLAAGFDGMAIYDNFVEPDTWSVHARNFSGARLLFSFNINAGFDGVAERVPPDDCYKPPPFAPGRGSFDWSRADDREAAERLGSARIAESLIETIAVQSREELTNAQRGFFVAYINSFNEWHEGTQFEPMKDRELLSADELAIGYHNHGYGTSRLEKLRDLLAELQ